jgi:uncharacterized protein DUF6745
LEKLTKRQETLMDVVAEEYIALLSRDPGDPKPEDVMPWLTIAYKEYGIDTVPEIRIAGSPEEALEITGAQSLDYCGLGDGGWVAFYDFFHRIKVLTKDDRIKVLTKDEFSECAALKRYLAVVFDSSLCREAAVLVRYPTAMHFDAEGRLHHSTGPAMKWADGTVYHAWHGVWVEPRIVEEPRSYTREQYDAITQVEVRRALAESAGWDWLVSLLDATVSDRWTDPVFGLSYELLAAGEQRWLRKQSPVLQDKSQPWYIEPVHEDLKTAQAARKWQATRLDVATCEVDPELIYACEA